MENLSMESESFVGSLENSIFPSPLPRTAEENDKVMNGSKYEIIRRETTMIHKFVLCIYAPEETKVG